MGVSTAALSANRMHLLTNITERLPSLSVWSVVDILLVAVLIYQFLLLIRGTRAAPMLVGVGALVLTFYVAHKTDLRTLDWLIGTLLPYGIFALIVVFAGEIRQVLARIGRRLTLSRSVQASVSEVYDDIILAANLFSQNQTGALIVIEREIGLRTYIESGVPLDAQLSYDLLATIFRPSAPLHDGAVIVQKDRIAAAACFLPLSINPLLSTQLGTRHRAGIGITEETDAHLRHRLRGNRRHQPGGGRETSNAISRRAVAGAHERVVAAPRPSRRGGTATNPPLPNSISNSSRSAAIPMAASRRSKSKMLDFIRQLFTRNFGLKVLSLAVAMLLWWTVAREPEAQVLMNVPIEFYQVPKDLQFSSEIAPQVQIRVRGPARVLRELAQTDIHPVIDLSKCNCGRTHVSHSRQFHPHAQRRGDRADHPGAASPELRPAGTARGSRACANHRYAGFRIPHRRQPRSMPPTVQIDGPSRRVRLIDSAITDPVDATGVIGSATFTTTVYTTDPLVKVSDPQPVRVTVVTQKVPSNAGVE